MYTFKIELDFLLSIIFYPEFIPMEDQKVNEKWENNIRQLSDYLKDQNLSLRKLLLELDKKGKEELKKEKSRKIFKNKNS